MATVAMARPRRALGELSSSRSNKHAMLKHLQVGMSLHPHDRLRTTVHITS